MIAAEGIQPVAKRVRDLHNLKSPKTKTEVKSFLGALGFYSCYIKNLHVDSRQFYELTKKDTNFCWKQEHEVLFQEIKKRRSEDTVLAVPSTKYPSHTRRFILRRSRMYPNTTIPRRKTDYFLQFTSFCKRRKEDVHST